MSSEPGVELDPKFLAYLDQKIPEFREWLQLGVDTAKDELGQGIPPETIIALMIITMDRRDPMAYKVALAVTIVDQAKREMAGD